MKNDISALRTASELAIQGKTTEAIACLESALARTRSERERPDDVSLLARTAGLHCEQAGLYSQSALYYEEALATGDSNPLLLLALADMRWRLGEAEAARSCLARAEAMLQAAPDADVSTMIANIRARWVSGIR